MNQLTLLVVVLVAFCYFGGKYCPSALKKNKEMLLGVAGGLVLCSFFGLRLEGFKVDGRNFTSIIDCYSSSGSGRDEQGLSVRGAAWSEERRRVCDTQKANQTDAAGGAATADALRQVYGGHETREERNEEHCQKDRYICEGSDGPLKDFYNGFCQHTNVGPCP